MTPTTTALDEIESLIDFACERTKHHIANAALTIADRIERGELRDTGGADALRAFAKSMEATLMLLGTEAHKHFYDDDETARAWLKAQLEAAPP